MTANDKPSHFNREDFPQQIEMQLSQKVKKFSESFIAFLKSALNSEYFETKEESNSLSTFTIIDCETGGYLHV